MNSCQKVLAAVVCVAVLVGASDWLEELQAGRELSFGPGLRIRVDRNPESDNPASYFGSHMLRFELGEAGLSVAKAKDRDGLQIDLYQSVGDPNGQARGEVSVAKVFFPLLLGFKVAGTILTTLVAVIIVSLKAFLASKLALLLTGTVALKKLFSPDPHGLAHYPAEVHPQYYQAHDFPPDTDYEAPVGHDAEEASHAAEYGPSSHEAADSNMSAQYAQPLAAGAGSTTGTPVKHHPAIKRRVFFKQPTTPIVPVLTMHRITHESIDRQLQ